MLGAEAHGVRLERELASVEVDQTELVPAALAGVGDEDLPDARLLHRCHRGRVATPVVEVTAEVGSLGVGRPHGEMCAPLLDVGAEDLPEASVRAFVEEMAIVRADACALPGLMRVDSSHPWVSKALRH